MTEPAGNRCRLAVAGLILSLAATCTSVSLVCLLTGTQRWDSILDYVDARFLGGMFLAGMALGLLGGALGTTSLCLALLKKVPPSANRVGGFAVAFAVIGVGLSVLCGVAIPSMIQSPAQRNECMAVGRLKTYAVAQDRYRQQHGRYSASMETLAANDGSLRAIRLMAQANEPAHPLQGYYFILVGGNEDRHIMYACPALYGETGINTLVIDETGNVLIKDLEGKHPDTTQRPDSTWYCP
jgi:type II secretory pathway pseudopilin PulG